MSRHLKYKGYLGSVEVSLEDNCLHGRLLHVRDVVSYEASNVDRLRNAFEEAVDDYLETCTELGRQPQKPFSGTFNIRVGPEIHRTAVIRANVEGVSLNDFIKDAIKQKLENKQHDPFGSYYEISKASGELRVIARQLSTFSLSGTQETSQDDENTWPKIETSTFLLPRH